LARFVPICFKKWAVSNREDRLGEPNKNLAVLPILRPEIRIDIGGGDKDLHMPLPLAGLAIDVTPTAMSDRHQDKLN
jgi:hypothetical protein